MRKYLVFAIFLFASRNAYCSHVFGSYQYYGYVVLKNNNLDTLYGEIRLSDQQHFNPFRWWNDYIEIIETSNEGNHSTRSISKDEIVTVRLFNEKKECADFYPLKFKRIELYKLIASDKANVYRLDDRVSETYEASFLIIVNKDSTTKIPAYFNFNNKSKLVKFINERYNQHFRKNDFPSSKDIVLYIASHG
jgi:hypothetical protein